MPVRIKPAAVAVAKKAAGLHGQTLSAYASRVLLEAANRDLDDFARTRFTGRDGQDKPKRSKGLESGK
jgi:hypothetical protein